MYRHTERSLHPPKLAGLNRSDFVFRSWLPESVPSTDHS